MFFSILSPLAFAHILLVYTLVPTGCKRQIAQSIAAEIGHFFGVLAGRHTVQLVAGVDMGALVGFVGLLIVLILGARILGFGGLIGVVRLVDLVAAVRAWRHIAARYDKEDLTNINM